MKPQARIPALIGLSIVAAFLAVVPAVSAAAPANLRRGCVQTFDPSADYFPDKVSVEDAAIFGVEYRKSYKIVTVKQAYAGGPAERYVLAQCGTPAPPLTGDLAGAQIVTVPIGSLFVFSTTHLSLLADLDRLDVLTGVAQRNVTVNPSVDARINGGQVVEFAKVGLVIDVERVVASKPSLLMASGTSNAAIDVIRHAGIPVVANTEWLEATALGRAEWLKYMALFLNEERTAQATYDGVRERYHALAKRVEAIPAAERPLVMTGRSTRGLFTIAGGRSYVAALIKDAGGRYVWADNTSAGTASVDLEMQLQRAADAGIWINGGGWSGIAAMLDDEPRYAGFKAWRQHQVWVYERRLTPAGANDYWSRGTTHPDVVLADLVKVFHPRLALDHTFEWYMPVPDEK